MVKNLEFWKVKLLLTFCYLLHALIYDYYTPAPSGSASFARGGECVHAAPPFLRLILLRGKVLQVRRWDILSSNSALGSEAQARLCFILSGNTLNPASYLAEP